MPNIYPLLPRLSDNPHIPLSVTGQWEQAVGATGIVGLLKGLADDLVVSKDARKIDSVDSIPDIWARPILFRMALFASEGFDQNLHKKVLGEWRALLAMLALQDMRHLHLKVDAVNLGTMHGNALAETLLQLAPQDAADGTGNAAWRDMYVISYRNVPLAITSPTTLVAAAANYSQALAGKLPEPWSIDKEQLSDPIERLRPEELSGLSSWLDDLKTNLSQAIPAHVQNKDTCNRLFKALKAYMDDVKNEQAKPNKAAAIGGNVVPAGHDIGIGLAQFLDKKVQAPPVMAEASVVRLCTSPARNTAETPRLLVSLEMLKKLSVSRGLSLADIVIWSGITGADINGESLAGSKTMINNVSLGNAEWRRPEDFFTDRLTFIAGGKALKGIIMARGSQVLANANAVGDEPVSVILPFRPELLEYFTPQEIATKTQIDKIGGDTRVRFTFPISGIDGKGDSYTVERIFKDIIYLVVNVPVIEIWPNFRRAGWKRYYLYYENSEAGNDTQGVGRDFFYVYPWAYGEDIAGDTPQGGLMNRYTARLSGFPEALLCTVNMTAPDGVSDQPIEAGIVLLDTPPLVATTLGQNWKIGIDFGTSSTMLFHRNGANPPQPLALQPNLFQVTESATDRLQIYKNFIPSDTSSQQPGSFLSIFQLLNGEHLHATPPYLLPLQDGNVFWLSTGDKDDADHFRNNSTRIDANLKWQSASEGKLKVAAYVKQICLQSLAEAARNGVSTVSWNFSYPTAFSSDQEITFKATCNQAAYEAMEDSGFVAGHGGAVHPDFWLESQACAYYFNHLGGVNFAGGAVCLDIGAGTTDISVISGKPAKIVYHTSLQFAGRQLFQSIYDHYDIFAKSVNLERMEKEKRNALIDADMRKKSDDYLSSLPMVQQNNLKEMLKKAQFAAAGIFYYLGGLVGLLHERGIYQGDSVPDVYVGGNGSRIFHWICGGQFSPKNDFLKVFQNMLVAASNLSTKAGFRMILSGTPKVEVACGMVEDLPHHHDDFFDADAIASSLFGTDGQDPLIANSVLAGDAFTTFEGQQRSKTDFISAYDIVRGISVEHANELRAFTNAFNQNRYIWNRVIISDEEFEHVAQIVDGDYSRHVSDDPGSAQNIFVEPVFILELKGFLGL